MHSEPGSRFLIRPLVPADRPAVEDIIQCVGNFNAAERSCAVELMDIYLRDPNQKDYRIVVAEDIGGRIGGYACFGPTPMTVSTYDLYWIASHPDLQGQGFGRSLMSYIEDWVGSAGGRLLIVETSSKESYGKTVGFYRRSGYEEASRIRDFYDASDDKITFVKRFPGKE